ncbi:MAG: IclR family transcriptional regulator [Spirochaetales bacterium]|nr:IclR family transcriptional regulator [Spirochaetales bacterium]
MDKKPSNLEKITRILQILGTKPYLYSAAEIGHLTGINRTTVYRILTDLAAEHFVIQEKVSRKFTVGPMLYHIGSVYLNNYHYKHEVLHTLEKVAELTGESAGLAIRDGDRILSLFEIEMRQPFRMNHPPGSLYPMNRGCYGKCLMAYHQEETVKRLLRIQPFEKLFPNTLTTVDEILDEYRLIRRQGYVISDGEEYDAAAAGVGVPVKNLAGEVMACMAIAFIKGPDFDIKINSSLPILQKYAEEITPFIP